MFITNGENIYPAEIEEAIMRYPGVMLCAVVAVPHEIAGEVGRAYIAPLPDVTIEVEKLKEFLKEYLASYKIPREYVFREMLPMTLDVYKRQYQGCSGQCLDRTPKNYLHFICLILTHYSIYRLSEGKDVFPA